MGAASSKFSETDWSRASGRLAESSSCLDGSNRTDTYSIVTLTKQTLLNQRGYHIYDEDDKLIYKTLAVEGTAKSFDVLSGSGGETLLRVQTDLSHTYWDVFRYGTPTFSGQVPDTEASAKVDTNLFKCARVTIASDRYHATVTPYGKEELKHGQSEEMGSETSTYSSTPSDPTGTLLPKPILNVEGISSITAQYQSFLPSSNVVEQQIENILPSHQPLVGYWMAENTEKKQRIKLHLAKHSDLSLHIILAIMTNMIHVERRSIE